MMRLMTKIILYRQKILFSSTCAVFLLAIVVKTLEIKKSKIKLSKSQRKDFLQSKFFFKGMYQKIRLEITGHEGIKYSKMQSFLDQISKKSLMKISKQKNPKEDKVFYCLLNNYLNKKQAI